MMMMTFLYCHLPSSVLLPFSVEFGGGRYSFAVLAVSGFCHMVFVGTVLVCVCR